jgi:hypothetical protein
MHLPRHFLAEILGQGIAASGRSGCSSVMGAKAGRVRLKGKPRIVSLDAQTTRGRPSSVAALKTL